MIKPTTSATVIPLGRPNQEWPHALLAVALVLLFCLGIWLRDPGFFWIDDYQAEYLPVYRDIARAWEEGELPLLSPYSWYSGAIAGEYQYGTFSIFINLVIILVWKLGLTLPATATVFSMIHLGILAGGAFLLARQRGLAANLAVMVAPAASLNGWIIGWAANDWIPALTSFAWVPWAWRALERAMEIDRGPWRFLPAGFFIYLILTTGWPYSVLMIMLITTFLALKHGWRQWKLARLWPLLAAWILGTALAMPALLMLIEYFQVTSRTGMAQTLHWEWVVPPPALLGLVLPNFATEWSGWGARTCGNL